MKGLLKWIILIVVAFIVMAIYGITLQESEKGTVNKVEERYNNATQGQKNCVNTLGQGVYKDKTLAWKLDSCNVPR